jgi:hypothetical protein
MLRTTIALTLLVAGTCSVARADDNTGSLMGHVDFYRDRTPIAGVAVRLVSPSLVATATTDKSGHFVFMNLLPARYSIEAFPEQSSTMTAPASSATMPYAPATFNDEIVVFAGCHLTARIGLDVLPSTISHIPESHATLAVNPGDCGYNVTKSDVVLDPLFALMQGV